MEFIENLLPKTRLYRENLRAALQSHNITVVDHKTRNYHGSFWDLCRAVNAGRDAWQSYSLVRTVTFWVEKNAVVDRDRIDAALSDVQVWAVLCGTHLVLEIDTDKDHWRIKAACVIS